MPLNFLIDYNACLFMYDDYNYGHMSEGFTGMWIRRSDLYVGDDARELRNGDDWHVPILKYQCTCVPVYSCTGVRVYSCVLLCVCLCTGLLVYLRTCVLL